VGGKAEDQVDPPTVFILLKTLRVRELKLIDFS